MTTPGQARFASFAWGVLGYTILVILWGAFVRASGSGDGCGNHWPLCDGELIPLNPDAAMMIEKAHRLSSALAGFLSIGLVIGAARAFPKRDASNPMQYRAVRRAAWWTLFFMTTEALIGAVLVKQGWVKDDASIGRAVFLAIHLVNTFLLVASMALAAWWASGHARLSLRSQGSFGWALGVALFGLLLLGVSGAVNALGDTIRPMADSAATVKAGLQPTAHFLDRLRLIHPTLAISVGLYILLVAGLAKHLRPTDQVNRWANAVIGLLVIEMTAGFVNVLLKAPVWMQILHLLLADGMWIALILLSASALAEGVPHGEVAEAPKGAGKAGFKEYVALTKPRVISLLLFTTVTAMFAAANGWPGLWSLIAVMLGGYMSAGAANTINMVVERDLDERMGRTAKRPTVTNTIPPQNALMFGFFMALGSFALLWAAANLLTAMLAFAGLTFYVIVYTLLLKRRTWQNIVIGGAAGAFPPLVGWASVTNELSPMAWVLFAIVFFWTPVHFWALALMIKDDYAKAGVPMLPVVRGDRYTVGQIVLYAFLTTAICALPILLHETGRIYLVAAVVLNLLLIVKSFQLYRRIEKPQTLGLYKYSMLYLALLFVAVALDKAWTL
ncbi:MAG: hypothetical protein AMXMBFR81_10400 [Chthonomonas sp.]